MAPQRLDITLAFKAISLSDGLTGTDKQVAAAIIDSFNYRTQQCDPSFDRIAHLVGRSRRTIIRSVQHLERKRFLIKIRHGGHYHRNLYQPNWVGFRQLEASWKARKRTRHWGPKESPSKVPASGHIAGDELGTQTIPINQSSETSPPPPRIPGGQELNKQSWTPNRQEYSASKPSGPAKRYSQFTRAAVTDAATAARLSAERRWNGALLRKLADRRDVYAQAIEAIDLNLQQEATEAELKRRGSGLAHIIKTLASKGVNL